MSFFGQGSHVEESAEVEVEVKIVEGNPNQRLN